MSDQTWSQYEDAEAPMIFHDGETILHMNRAACTLFCIDDDQLIGTPALFLIDPAFRKLGVLRMDLLKGDLKIGESLPTIEYPFYRLRGARFWAYVDSTRIAEGVICSRLSRIAEDC